MIWARRCPIIKLLVTKYYPITFICSFIWRIAINHITVLILIIQIGTVIDFKPFEPFELLELFELLMGSYCHFYPHVSAQLTPPCVDIRCGYEFFNIIKIRFYEIIFDAEHDKIMQTALLRLQFW